MSKMFDKTVKRMGVKMTTSFDNDELVWQDFLEDLDVLGLLDEFPTELKERRSFDDAVGAGLVDDDLRYNWEDFIKEQGV